MTETETNKINPADGERFAQDLKMIREQSGTTLEDLNQLTKIPLKLLSDFEINALLGNPLFNQVYLRSLVRTYAAATGVDPALAIQCLESATIGMYHGELRQSVPDKPRSSAPRSTPVDETSQSSSVEQRDDAVQTDGTVDAEPASVELRKVSQPSNAATRDVVTRKSKSSRRRRAAKSVRSPKTISKEPTSDTSTPKVTPTPQTIVKPQPEKKTNAGSGSTPISEPIQPRDSYSQAASVRTDKSSLEVDQTDLDRKAPISSSSPQSTVVDISSRASDLPVDRQGLGAKPGFVLPRSSVFTIVSSLAVVGLLVVVTLVLWKTFDGGPVDAAVAVDDTTSIERVLTPQESTAVVTPAVVAPELGETIRLNVVASGGNLRPIRVKVDRDLRRPYWIDKDSVRTFEFTNQIVLEENIELISLSISGFDYPLGRNPGTKVVISRELVESFYSSLPSR